MIKSSSYYETNEYNIVQCLCVCVYVCDLEIKFPFLVIALGHGIYRYW